MNWYVVKDADDEYVHSFVGVMCYIDLINGHPFLVVVPLNGGKNYRYLLPRGSSVVLVRENERIEAPHKVIWTDPRGAR